MLSGAGLKRFGIVLSVTKDIKVVFIIILLCLIMLNKNTCHINV